MEQNLLMQKYAELMDLKNNIGADALMVLHTLMNIHTRLINYLQSEPHIIYMSQNNIRDLKKLIADVDQYSDNIVEYQYYGKTEDEFVMALSSLENGLFKLNNYILNLNITSTPLSR
jgi:hypothetical protein